MALSPVTRKVARHALAAIAVSCVAFAGISVLLTMEAGTLQLDGDYPDGAAQLILSSLSVIRFKGIIPTNETTSESYQVTIHWFLNALGWEWPNGSWELSSGIIHNINGWIPLQSLTLPKDLGLAAAGLRLPESDFQCIPPRGQGGICHNEFLAAWDEAGIPSTSFGTTYPALVYWFAIITLLAILLQEIAIHRFPHFTKCYCPAFISDRGWCACVKKDESLTPEIRNRMRTWYLVLLGVVYAMAYSIMLIKGSMLLQFLRGVDSKVGGMDPQFGRGFLLISSLTQGAIILSVLCLRVRLNLTKSQRWMEQQQGIGENVHILDQDYDTDKEADFPQL